MRGIAARDRVELVPTMRGIRTPMQIAGVDCAKNPTPERGEHTEQVLAEFGFTADEIAALRTAKAA